MSYRVTYGLSVLAVLVAWSAALFAGFFWLQSVPAKPVSPPAPAAACSDATGNPRQAGFPAKRPLAVNHWIGQGDLEWAAPTGPGVDRSGWLYRYSACPVRLGALAGETWDRPQVESSPGRLAYPLALSSDPALARTLNAGSRIDVWDHRLLLVRDMIVLTVQCTSGRPIPGMDCWALLDAAPDDVSRLQKAPLDSLVVVVKTQKP